MKNEKNLWRSIIVIAALLTVLAIVMVGTASAKSLYVNADLNANSPIHAYDIQLAPTYLVFQQNSTPTRYGGVGLAIDTDSEILFITFEFSGTLDIVDAKTLNILGNVTAPNATDLAGIVVDQDKQKVYAVDRDTNHLYVYSWNATSKTLTNDITTSPYYIALPGIINGGNWPGTTGLALDEVNDLLYVADYTTTVKCFHTGNWSSAGSFTVSHQAMGIAVDVSNGFVYTGSWSSINLSKYDLNTNTETTLTIGTLPNVSMYETVLGLAVDSNTSLLYTTTGFSSDMILVFNSNLGFLYNTSDIGNPTGIVVPGKEISYNPLNLSKDDGLGGACVSPGANITYTISYTNTNPHNVTGVTINDTLPPEVTFVSCTGGGSHFGNTVTWNIGNITTGASGSVTLTVQVNLGTLPGTNIINSATINGAEPGTGPTTVSETTVTCLNQPPDITDAHPSIDCLWPPNHKFVDITIEGVTDPDGDNVTITIIGITSDEPTSDIDGAGGAGKAPDADPACIGTPIARVRAERSGTGNGRVYEITFVASDGNGGETEGTVKVCVPHDVRKGTCIAIDDGQIYDATTIN